MASRHGPAVLELAAGTGRLALEVLGSGCDYTGLEASEAFLARAREKLAQYNNVRLLPGDMRDFDLSRQFDLIFIGFNSFLHLLKDEDALATLRCVRRHCHQGTRFVIDIFVPDPVFLYRPEGKRVETMTYYDPDTGERVTVEETNSYDPEPGINHIYWYYSTAGRQDFLSYKFTMRMYFPDTIDRLFHEAGFQILEKWGDYTGKKLSPDSQLQIYITKAMV